MMKMKSEVGFFGFDSSAEFAEEALSSSSNFSELLPL